MFSNPWYKVFRKPLITESGVFLERLGFKNFQSEWTPIIEKHLDLQPSKVLTFLNIDVESHRGLGGYYRKDLVPSLPIPHVSVQSITAVMAHLPFDITV